MVKFLSNVSMNVKGMKGEIRKEKWKNGWEERSVQKEGAGKSKRITGGSGSLLYLLYLILQQYARMCIKTYVLDSVQWAAIQRRFL